MPCYHQEEIVQRVGGGFQMERCATPIPKIRSVTSNKKLHKLIDCNSEYLLPKGEKGSIFSFFYNHS